MEGSSRRAFLLGVLGLGLSGCARKASSLVSDNDREYLRTLEEENRKVASGELSAEALPANLATMPRSAWAVGSPIKTRLRPMGRIKKITVHHEGSDVNTSTSRSDVVDDLRDIRRVHLRSMHAGDIGYHYIIDRAGRAWEGRPLQYQGAHSGGNANVGNLGIMLLGNFDLQRPSEKQRAALRELLVCQMRNYSVPRSLVFTHRELRATRCPGSYLQSHMDKIRRTA